MIACCLLVCYLLAWAKVVMCWDGSAVHTINQLGQLHSDETCCLCLTPRTITVVVETAQ